MDNADERTLAPDDAVAVLGNETRLSILRALGEAVLSGAVTDTPTLERTAVDQRCEYCGGPVEARWHEGSAELFCTSCAGKFTHQRGDEPSEGYLGRLTLPPAGLRGRDPDEVVRTAWTWTQLEVLAFASGICPRCSATVEHDRSVCERHDASEGLCDNCDRHHAITILVECTNCIYGSSGAAVLGVLADMDVLSFSRITTSIPSSPTISTRSIRPTKITRRKFSRPIPSERDSRSISTATGCS